MIDSREYEHDIPDYVVTKIHEMADKDSNGKLDFEEFVEMINHPDLAPLFGHYVNKWVFIWSDVGDLVWAARRPDGERTCLLMLTGC